MIFQSEKITRMKGYFSMVFSSSGTVHRSTVTGTHGMTASGHPLASLAGLKILMQGGNAIDAAIATAAALNVVEPYMSGIGGVGYMHIYDSATDEHSVLDYVGLTPSSTDISLFTTELQSRGPLSHLIPGACSGWLEALQKYGRMDATTVFQPAIEYAEQGIALTIKNAEFFSGNIADLKKFQTGAENYLVNNTSPTCGDIIFQKNLAETFRQIANEGSEIFYTGSIAKKITKYVQDQGGLLTLEDLNDYRSKWTKPIDIKYRDYTIYAPAPPCQALQYLQTLKIMEGYDVQGMGHNSTEFLHHFIEATKLSMADRAEYASLSNAPSKGLLAEQYIKERRLLIGKNAGYTGGERFTSQKERNEILPGQPPEWMLNECTTHFNTIDKDGNAVSCTQSLGSGFGSAMVVPGTGITLNNFMKWFDIDPLSPNAIGPSKKLEMCLSPAQVWDDYGLRLLIGTPGGHGILQTTPQMIMNVLDHDFNVQSAIEAPRVKTGQPGYLVDIESRINTSVQKELEKRGHILNQLGDWSPAVGGGQGIHINPENGSFMGGADPRRDGYVLGW